MCDASLQMMLSIFVTVRKLERDFIIILPVMNFIITLTRINNNKQMYMGLQSVGLR